MNCKSATFPQLHHAVEWLKTYQRDGGINLKLIEAKGVFAVSAIFKDENLSVRYIAQLINVNTSRVEASHTFIMHDQAQDWASGALNAWGGTIAGYKTVITEVKVLR